MTLPADIAEKLFVTDLDGTLLRGDQTVSAFTVATLNRLIARGVKITYATARSYRTASLILRDINFALPCITHNGAGLAGADGRTLAANLLDAGIAGAILHAGERMGLRPFVSGNDASGRERLFYREPVNGAQADFTQERLRIRDPRLYLVHEPTLPESTIVMHYVHLKPELEPLKAYIDDKYGSEVEAKFMEDIYFPGYYGLEVYHPQANKGAMLKELCRQLDISAANVVVFGDQLNDLEMFAFAGHGIAVANAHHELKKRAHEVIGSNTVDGVARYLQAINGV